MPEFVIKTEAELRQISDFLWKNLSAGAVVLLAGDLGAGKTALVRNFLQRIDSPDHAKSPTYTIVRTYQTILGTINHLDLYRLSGPDDLLQIGWPELCAEGFATFVEWPERLEDELPATYWRLDFEILPDEARRVKIRQFPAELLEKS